MSRRAFLRGSGAGLAALAGCRALGIRSGDDVRGLSGDAARGTAPLHRWLYPPASVGPTQHATFFALDVDAIEAHADALRSRTVEKYRGYVRTRSRAVVAVDPDSVTGLLQVFPDPTAVTPQGAVLRGTLDSRALRERLGERFPARHDVGCVTVHADGQQAAALVDGHLLLGAPVTDAPGRVVVRALLAARGSGPRYQRRSRPLRRVLDALGTGHDLSGRTRPPTTKGPGRDGRFAGEVARGHRYRIRGERTDSRYAFAFTDRAAASAARPSVERWVTTTDRLFEPYRTVTVRRSEELVVVEGRLPTRSV